MTDEKSEDINNNLRWQKFLDILDEKLQLGLLTHLRKVQNYSFDNDTLILEIDNQIDLNYFKNEAFLQQLKVLAKDAISVKDVIIKG
jgi:hypothetical protein